MTEAATFPYKFRDGQKEAFMEELRSTARFCGNTGGRLHARYSEEVEEVLAGLARDDGDDVTLSKAGVSWLEIFARFDMRGRELFDDEEREYLARCRLGGWARGLI